MYLRDRTHAGQLLAEALSAYQHTEQLLVLGLPRGGVPVAYEVARSLGASLDVFIVRKLGLPGHEELAMGALSSGGGQMLNAKIIEAYGVEASAIERIAQRERLEITRREQLYRASKPSLSVQGKTVLLIDDGLATGSTMLAGVRALRHLQPQRLIAAVPVAPSSVCAELRPYLDDLICLYTPADFYSVGQWYEDFTQTSDADVCALLAAADQSRAELPFYTQPSARPPSPSL